MEDTNPQSHDMKKKDNVLKEEIDDSENVQSSSAEDISKTDLSNDMPENLPKKNKIKFKAHKLKNILSSRKIVNENNSKILIKCFDDRDPKPGKQYFIKGLNPKEEDIATVIPCFNESAEAVWGSLKSLYNTWIYLKSGSKKWLNRELYVCIIQDGWSKAHESMKEYFKFLFPAKINKNEEVVGKNEEGTFWWDYYEDFRSPKSDSNKTFIFQYNHHYPISIDPPFKNNNDPLKNYMRVSLIIKINNRRKFNSHKWFMAKGGFAESINPMYCFLTDAKTYYNKFLLYHLVKSMDKDSNMVATTGRQRLMSKKQQGSDESIISLGYILRHVQTFDFEASNVIYNGAFSFGSSYLGGFLPVVPGPCGLYRASAILCDKVRDYYFSTIETNPDEAGIIVSNMKTAEDRIFTYSPILNSDNPNAYMEFNPLALFYFEAETSLESLISQRRRWINGSVAGYIYLLFCDTNRFLSWKANAIRKLYIGILLLCQLASYLIVGIAPGISLSVLYYGLCYILRYYNLVDTNTFNFISIAIACLGLYLIHVVMHHRYKYVYWVMFLLLIVSFVTSIVSIFALLHYTFIFEKHSLLSILVSKNIIVYLALYVLFGPFLVSLLLSGRGHSFLFMLKSCLFYYLFLPMFVGWFGSYAYSRIWDISWGNRPANEMEAVTLQKRKQVEDKFKRISTMVIIILIVANFILFFLTSLHTLLVIVSVFFFLAGYQLTLSILFCLSKLFYKISFIFNKKSVKFKNNVV
jgi:cellulose synthase/poly-beta-1,6-N-acetylglucosamine synthase-like glycosyltransferase